MRSLFWRVLGAFWLALILTGTLTFLLTRFFNQDAWILSHHPAFSQLTEQWLQLYEQGELPQAQQVLHKLRQEHRIYTQVFDEDGQLVSTSSRMRNAPININNQSNNTHSNWRRLTQEISSPQGNTFLFIHRIPRSELAKWQYGHGFGPLLLVVVAVVVLTLISLLLTFSITRPLMRLRHAVRELGETAYQQKHLAELAQRKDEFGVLAADFNKMGQRLQNMLNSQRQLLRDVSHELRSPLARLQVGLALTERAPAQKQQEFWPKLALECERLDTLINEMLVLARMEQETPKPESFELCALLHELQDDCAFFTPEQQIQLNCPTPVNLNLAKSLLQRALDNLLRNAVRFSPADKPVEIQVVLHSNKLVITIRDHGPGVNDSLLSQLTQPFVREKNQQTTGYGLGLTITERAVHQLGGQLSLANHRHGGFIATIELPYFS